MISERISIESVRPFANSNILDRYAIESAKWIAHPDADTDSDQFYDFELDFDLNEKASFILHVSGDQRFELYCDDDYIGMGPDRSDLRNWSFHSYEMTLAEGHHRLVAKTHFIATHRAHAQVSRQPAFILAAEGAAVDLNTGKANWKVCRREGVTCDKPRFSDKWYQVVGPHFTIDAAKFFAEAQKVEAVALPETNLQGGRVGFIRAGWRLHPSRLPEQLRIRPACLGRIRMVADGVVDLMRESPPDAVAEWQAAISQNRELRLKAGTKQTVLWDLDEYYCAYPRLVTSAGKGSSINFEWAESCFEEPECRTKDDRNAIDGKYYEGYGDTYIIGGQDEESWSSFWWRAGRYLRLIVQVGAEDLVIKELAIEESRLPLEAEGSFASNDSEIDAIIPLAVRGIQMCAHETYMDCPYYEQMMYVGDARLQLLTSAVISHEKRLHQRCLELLDWSRHVCTFVLMRHPSDPRQLCTTFSMVWIMMIRDLAFWQRDPEFIAQLLPGMRAQLEQFRSLANAEMLFEGLPAWSFIDWVNSDGWDFAYPPEGEFGISGVCNLLFLLALQSAIDVEDAYGEKHFADSYREWAGEMAISIRNVFWDSEGGLFADDPGHKFFSEHAQCLAILTEMFDPETVARCFDALITREDLARTSIYFSFYLFETLRHQGRGDIVVKKLDFWKDLVRKGFKAPVEQPEPSRSDCHAWGSHPLFHMNASLCGIRTASAGFGSVHIAPQPGGLTHLKSRTCHPDGYIDFEMSLIEEEWRVMISLPAELTGTLEFQEETFAIAGSMDLTISVKQ